MSFRPLLARAGAAAAAGGAVLNQPAQARSAPIPQQQQATAQQFADAKSAYDDEWTVAQFDKGDVIFLRPEEIHQAADDFRHATYGMRNLDDHDETSSNESDERRATEVIELSESMHQASRHGTTHINGEGVSMLLDLATEMLKRPAVQQEVMSIIADNPRLHRALLAPPPPSPAHLGAPHPILLLDAPPFPVIEELEDEAEGAAAGAPHEGDAWHGLLSNLQQTLAAMGSQLGGLRMRLAHWLGALLPGRGRTPGQAQHEKAVAAGAAAAEGGAAAAEGGAAAAEGGAASGGDGTHPFLRAALAVAVVLACIAVARRPGLAVIIAAVAAQRAASRK